MGFSRTVLSICFYLNSFLLDIFKMDAIMDFLYTIISGVILFWIKIIISWSFTIYSNLYTIVIGRKFSSVDLGFFSRGQTMAYFVPSNMTNIVTMAMYPILCSIQDDYVKLKKTFKVYIRLVCFIFFPIMIILAVLSEPIIKIVLTDKWLPSVFYVQILCIAYMWDPLMRINANILSVVGRTDYSLKSEIIKKVISVIVLFITIPFGIDVMCIGLACEKDYWTWFLG